MGYRSSTGENLPRPPDATSLGASAPPLGAGLSPMRRLALVIAALLALSGASAGPALAQATGSGPGPTSGDAVAAADADIARLSQQAEALSDQYFAALGRLADAQRRIDDLESRVPALAAEVAELRARTLDRAVAASIRSGRDLTAVAGAGGPLDAARRVQWLDRLNAHDGELASELAATSARLTAQRADLRGARDAAATALDAVLAQGRTIDALLVDARERRRLASTPPPTGGSPTAAAGAASDPAPGPVGTPGPTTTTTTAAKSSPPAAAPTAPPTYSPTPGTHPHHDEPFLVCLRTREASGNYAAYNPAGPYMGAYQFLQSTWNSAANHAGRSDLVGVPPHTASPYDQDDVAWALYQWRGSGPWGGTCDPG